MTDLIKRKDVYEVLEKYFKGGFGSIYDMVKEIPTVEVADRKTENSSEKPNNCEPQTEKTCDNCGTPKHLCKYCIAEDRMWTPKEQTEPQTEEWYTYQDEQEYNDRWQTDEPQTDCSWKKGE